MKDNSLYGLPWLNWGPEHSSEWHKDDNILVKRILIGSLILIIIAVILNIFGLIH